MVSEMRIYPRLFNIYKIATRKPKIGKFDLPTNLKRNGLILNPEKFELDIKDNLMSLADLKRLLFMMTPGISRVIDKLSQPKKGLLVNAMV